MFLFRASLAFLLIGLVVSTYGGGGYGGGYSEYDCGGSCGGGCGGNPCNSAPATYVQTSGCSTGECGGGSSSRYSSSSGASSGYHKSVTTVTKEQQQSSLKIIVGQPTVHRTTYVQPQPVVHRTTYVQPQPVVHRTTYIDQPAPQPQVIYKKQRYVDEGDYSGSGCAGPCGGGSKIVKIIKKTSYGSGDGCTTCAAESYSGDLEYSEQPTVVRKVTRIVTQPKVVRVVKTVVDQEPSGEYYDSGSYAAPQGGYQKKHYRGGGGGAAKAGAFAFASASASAGAGSSGGDYVGGGGGGCKSGCDEWKK